jgi:hypothetical protein
MEIFSEVGTHIFFLMSTIATPLRDGRTWAIAYPQIFHETLLRNYISEYLQSQFFFSSTQLQVSKFLRNCCSAYLQSHFFSSSQLQSIAEVQSSRTFASTVAKSITTCPGIGPGLPGDRWSSLPLDQRSCPKDWNSDLAGWDLQMSGAQV